jgi:adenylosuccinate lyase
VIDGEQIKDNFENSRFWYSEAILLSLISAGLTRKESHDIVQEIVSKASKIQIGRLLGVVLTHPKVCELISDGKLNKDDLINRCSVGYALRHIDKIIEDIDVY